MSEQTALADNPPMMACGHRANAVNGNGDHACAICFCSEVAVHPPDLTGRVARCSYYGSSGRNGKICRSEQSSTSHLAFFEHVPGKDFDRYYCGCWGWD